MDTEEKLKIIKNWTFKLSGYRSPTGEYYISMIYSARFLSQDTTHHARKHELVVDEAYNAVYAYVFNEVSKI